MEKLLVFHREHETPPHQIVGELQQAAAQIRLNTGYVAVCDMWGPGSMKLSRKIDEEYVDAYDKCWTTLQTYTRAAWGRTVAGTH